MLSIYSSIQAEPLTTTALREALAAHLADDSVALSVGPLGMLVPVIDAELGTAGHLLVVRLAPAKVYLSAFALPLRAARFAPCPECLDRRLQSALNVVEQAALMNGSGFAAASPFLIATALQNVLLLASQIVERRRKLPAAPQQVFALNLISHHIAESQLMADSFCSQCDPEQTVSDQDAVFSLRDSLQARVGKSRMKALAEYDLPMRALSNDVCGATCLHWVFGYAQSITAPVYGQYAQRAFDVPPRIVGWSGMCTRADESRVAGVLEALERQAGMLAHPDRIVAFDSYENLKENALDPDICFSYNDEAYARSPSLTRYRPDLKIAWQWGYSLFTQKPLLVPRQLVYYDRIGSKTVKVLENSSSGVALGSCYEEAVLRALLELFERDSFVIAWFRQLALPRIDPDTCFDRKTRLILDRIKLLGYDLSLLDGRLDMQVPVVVAIGRRRDREIGSMVVGASASTDAADAVRGALLEAATSIVEVPALLRSQEAHIREIADDYYRVQSVSDHGLLYGLPHMSDKLRWLDSSPVIRSMQDTYPSGSEWHSRGDIGADLQRCFHQLKSVGVSDAIVVDLTTREQKQLGLCTVRVIAPGLAPLDFGFPRNRVERLPRFWSAPDVAGLKPLGRERINPLPHPFP